MAKRKFKTDKKSDRTRKAKPVGYRYRVGDNKEHPLYYKRPTAEEIEKFEAGDKKMKARIYKEGRVDHADSSQTKKLEKGGEVSNDFVYKGEVDGHFISVKYNKEKDSTNISVMEPDGYSWNIERIPFAIADKLYSALDKLVSAYAYGFKEIGKEKRKFKKSK